MSNIPSLDHSSPQFGYAALQIPKIKDILLQAKTKDLPLIYPDLKHIFDKDNNQIVTDKNESGDMKKKAKKKNNTGLKLTGSKTKKEEIYEKYYLDETKMKKFTPLKKCVDILPKENWEEYLETKRKYQEFQILTNQMKSQKMEI